MARYTIDDYNALLKIYKNGVNTVKYSDKTIIYNSKDDIKKILDEMETELGIKNNNRGIFANTQVVSYNKE